MQALGVPSPNLKELGKICWEASVSTTRSIPEPGLVEAPEDSKELQERGILVCVGLGG